MTGAEDLLSYLPAQVARILKRQDTAFFAALEEVTLKPQGKLLLTFGGKTSFAKKDGRLCSRPGEAYTVSPGEIAEAMERITSGSYYSVQGDIREGFVTLPGGHRVGICGKAAVAQGRISSITDISSLNYRVARALPGCADGLVLKLLEGGRVCSTLIAGPPRCGKTTLLRDLARQLSDGAPAAGFPGVKVAISDERGEIAACVAGIAQLSVGVRTDVMYGLPKAQAMRMLIRSMSPTVLITDELGTEEDAAAVRAALSAGVSVIATVHGAGLAEVRLRKSVWSLVEEGAFSRIVLMDGRDGAHRIREVVKTGGKDPPEKVGGQDTWS